MLEHGGNLRDAALRFGRPLPDWLDLSTGINPQPYPVPALAVDVWHRLPENDPALALAACAYYNAPRMLPVAGTQAAIQALPRLRALSNRPSRVTVAAPSYAEHAHHWAQHGHQMRQVPYAELDAAVEGEVDACDVLVVCNPNNPTGATVAAERLLDWAERLAARGGWLVVDEAFGDMTPHNSVARWSERPGLIVLRSVGKFFGLAGLRLGFVAAQQPILTALADLLGPWAVSGPAQQIGRAALDDRDWQSAMRADLRAAGARLRQLLASHGIASSGSNLYQWWPQPQATEFWRHMAQRGIWVRLFTQASHGIRLGLPPDQAGWQRLEAALADWRREQQ
ncbi:MAG: threonine-phosphate decarboxylase CobD [Oxalobacteraceae bacterium]|nr:threonine-phosphate decarboxylase CobD [Oxalobacteraceae bacterium]